MLESIILLLIYVCVAALVIYLIFWVLGAVGVPIPPMVVKIVWIIFGLVVLLLILKMLLPPLMSGHLLR